MKTVSSKTQSDQHVTPDTVFILKNKTRHHNLDQDQSRIGYYLTQFQVAYPELLRSYTLKTVNWGVIYQKAATKIPYLLLPIIYPSIVVF